MHKNDFFVHNLDVLCNLIPLNVIAGHSQGSAILRLVLRDYFKEHPEYYKRMVAAYAIGYSITNAKAIANEMVEFAGPQSYHQDDYSIFYNNVKDNVVKRIAAYKAN